jgi:hypothetical protein
MSLILPFGRRPALFRRKNCERRTSGTGRVLQALFHGLKGSRRIRGSIPKTTPTLSLALKILWRAGRTFHVRGCRLTTEIQRKLRRGDEGERPWFSTRVKTRFAKATSFGPDDEAPCRTIQGNSLTSATTPGIGKISVLWTTRGSPC